MPVLKNTSSTVQPQMFSLRDVEAHAAAIVARAKQQAEAIIQSAQLAGAELKKSAQEQGLLEGRAAGTRTGMDQGFAAGRQQALGQFQGQLTTLVRTLTEAAVQIEQSRQRLLHDADDDVVRLAIEIARKIVHRRGLADVNIVTESVREAMRFVVGQNDLRIAVHPTQQAAMTEALPALGLQFPNLKHVQIVADDQIAAGGARLCTRHGEVDVTLDSMVERVAAELLGEKSS